MELRGAGVECPGAIEHPLLLLVAARSRSGEEFEAPGGQAADNGAKPGSSLGELIPDLAARCVAGRAAHEPVRGQTSQAITQDVGPGAGQQLLQLGIAFRAAQQRHEDVERPAVPDLVEGQGERAEPIVGTPGWRPLCHLVPYGLITALGCDTVLRLAGHSTIMSYWYENR